MQSFHLETGPKTEIKPETLESALLAVKSNYSDNDDSSSEYLEYICFSWAPDLQAETLLLT